MNGLKVAKIWRISGDMWFHVHLWLKKLGSESSKRTIRSSGSVAGQILITEVFLWPQGIWCVFQTAEENESIH